MTLGRIGAAVLVAVLAGCSSGSTSDTSTQESQEPEATATAPELPNIAMKEDGKTPLKCSDWAGLEEDLQYGLAVNALVKMGAAPATPNKVAAVRRGIDTDCADIPDDRLWNVAIRYAVQQ